jgi:hypothetical protein
MTEISHTIEIRIRPHQAGFWAAVEVDGKRELDATVSTEGEAKKRVKNCLSTIKLKQK